MSEALAAMDTLQQTGHVPVNDSVKEGIIQLQCAHPQYAPGSDQKVNMCAGSCRNRSHIWKSGNP